MQSIGLLLLYILIKHNLHLCTTVAIHIYGDGVTVVVAASQLIAGKLPAAGTFYADLAVFFKSEGGR